MTRQYYQKKLKALLETADDEGFVQLLWAANALQNGSAADASRYLQAGTFPPEAVTDEISSPHAIHEWELETLANELLTTPKRKSLRHNQERTLNTANFQNITRATNYLRKLENVEFGHGPKTGDIFMEMKRITNRQFDWQRGYLNIHQFYRNAYVYGQGACAEYFEAQNGITFNQLSFIGFGIYASLAQHPSFVATTGLEAIGIKQDELTQALHLISLPISEARTSAHTLRANTFHTAYRPSIFRMKTCLAFGSHSERIRAPLPQLILERVTSGIFYDVVGGSGPIRSDYGKRFEKYCLEYLRAMLPKLTWMEEGQYRIKPNGYDTPDILCQSKDVLACVVECKASRMSYGGRYGNNLSDDRGYKELTKAVFQLWRFFSHCRRGLANHSVDNDTVGLVLTLEDWMSIANPLREKVLKDAAVLASESDPLILSIDKKPITFVAIDDLEQTLTVASEETFLRAIKASADRGSWHLSNVHKDFRDHYQPIKQYPFGSKMSELLPWWDRVQEEKQRQQDRD